MIDRSELKKMLDDMNFHNYADIVYDTDRKRIDILTCAQLDDEFRSLSGFVYIWTAHKPGPNDRQCRVVYVGMTMQNAHHRQSTWLSGLNAGHRARVSAGGLSPEDEKKLGRGRKIGLRIENEIKNGNKITYWIRHSDEQIVLGETVSLAKVEEDALIKRLHPAWNWEVESHTQEDLS